MSAWDQGWALGAGAAQQKYAHKQALSDEEFQTHLGEANQRITDLQGKLNSLDPNSPDHFKTLYTLKQVLAGRDMMFHPLHHPGALEKFGHLLHLNKGPQAPSATTQPTPTQMPPATSAPVGLPEEPAYQQATATNGRVSSTAQPGSPASTLPGLETPGPTLPARPAVKVQGPALTPGELRERLRLSRQAGGEAEQMAAALPQSPQDAAAQQTQAEIAAQNAKNDAALKWAADHGVTGQPFEDLTQHIAGVPVSRAKPMPGAKPYLGPGGRYYQAMLNADDTISEQAMPPDYKPPARPASTSIPNEIAASYRKDHGIADDAVLPEAVWDYLQRKSALDKAIPTKTTTTTLKENEKGEYVPVTVTNYKTPGGSEVLIDPMPMAQGQGGAGAPRGAAAPGGAGPGSTPAATQPAPGTAGVQKIFNLRKTAIAQTGAGNPPTAAAKPPGASGATSGNAHVGAPLFQGRTPASDTAKKNVDIAQKSYLDVQQAGPGAGNVLDPVGSQEIVLAWLRGRVNRVTATEIATVNNLGGIVMKLEGNWARYVSGTMTPQQYKWFLDSSKRNYDDAQTVYNQYSSPAGSNAAPAAPPAGSDPDIDDIVKGLKTPAKTP